MPAIDDDNPDGADLDRDAQNQPARTEEEADAMTDPDSSGLRLGSSVPRLGVLAWSFVGVVVTLVIVVYALAAVSEIMLPLTSPPCWP